VSALLLLLLAQWDPQRAEHLDQLGALLKRHTAYLEVKVKSEPRQPLAEKERNGFGVVLEDKLVATSYFVVDKAERVFVIGPERRKIEGRIVLADVQRRIALIRTDTSLATTGLAPAKILEKADRKPEADVFALVSTLDFAGVVHGIMTDTGSSPEVEGHPRTTLELYYAMPVFDAELRFVGFARTVAWDRDKTLLVPPDMITEARTATTAAAKQAKEPRKETRPWWAK
jgi:hypothetical protein